MLTFITTRQSISNGHLVLLITAIQQMKGSLGESTFLYNCGQQVSECVRYLQALVLDARMDGRVWLHLHCLQINSSFGWYFGIAKAHTQAAASRWPVWTEQTDKRLLPPSAARQHCSRQVHFDGFYAHNSACWGVVAALVVLCRKSAIDRENWINAVWILLFSSCRKEGTMTVKMVGKIELNWSKHHHHHQCRRPSLLLSSMSMLIETDCLPVYLYVPAAER